MNVADINSDFIGLNRLRGNRCTNPLEPRYEYDASQKSGLLKTNIKNNKNEQQNIKKNMKRPCITLQLRLLKDHGTIKNFGIHFTTLPDGAHDF